VPARTGPEVRDDDPIPGASNRITYALAAAIGLAGIVILWVAMRDGGRDARSDGLRGKGVPADARPAVVEGPRDAGPAANPPEPVDAGVPPPDAAVARRPIDAGVRTASADASPADEKKALAKKLLREARNLVSDGNYAAGLAKADESIEAKPSAEAYVVKADALRKMNKVDDAVAAIDKAIGMRARYADAWKMKGNILWGAGRRDEARPALEKYLELRPDGEDAESIRARLEGR
jgi:hypothetical protein